MINIEDKKLNIILNEIKIPAIKLHLNKISSSHFLPKLSRFINKKFYHLGVGSSINRYDNTITFYSSFADKKNYSSYTKNEKFLNFGSGAFFHNKWKNYDYPGQTPYYRNIQGKKNKDFFEIDLCDENLNITESDNSITLIYCSHTLEHLDQQSSKRFLKECYRILKKNGIIRLALPNTKNDFNLVRCLNSQSSVNENVKKNYILDATFHLLADTGKLDFHSIIELLNQSNFESHLFYKNVIKKFPEMAVFDANKPERHISYWDYDNLIEVTKDIGFNYIIPSYQGSSVASPFCNIHVFDNTGPHNTFCADIIK